MHKQDSSSSSKWPNSNSSYPDLYATQLSPGVIEQEFDDDVLGSIDAAPVYEVRAGSSTRNVTTSILDNGRFSVSFGGYGHEKAATLPPLPSYEPQVEAERQFAEHSFPLLSIVIQVVGSRGDIQPFVALGQELQKVGHRVRLATHNVFEDLVLSSEIDFYPIGGDPVELMAYMARNPGLMPKFQSIRNGDLQKKRKMVSEILEGCWQSCIQPDPVTGIPFLAEAIIANPPSFAHVHCAQALSIPVHMMFTMPWTATRTFPHPLANVHVTDTDPTVTNFLSYGMVNMLTWQGLGGLINSWRKRSLELEPVDAIVGINLIEILKVPFTYCWSPALIPKPYDWESRIDVCGFFFRDTPSYEPPDDIRSFLHAGAPPIYIGFGSIVMGDPDKITCSILEAVRATGVRVIVSRGWGNLGRGVENQPGILVIDECPHEWLFERVAAVIHHGGAGTTACGLLKGRPTAILPFFGDQPFWAMMVASSGAGPPPLTLEALNGLTLADTFKFLVAPETVHAATMISEKMKHEQGVKAAVSSFHRHLPVKKLSCDLAPRRAAVWVYKHEKRTFKLSHEAVKILVNRRKIDEKKLKRYKSSPIDIRNQRWDPITGAFSAYLDFVIDFPLAVGGIIEQPIREYRRVKSAASTVPIKTRPSSAYSESKSSQSSANSQADSSILEHETTLVASEKATSASCAASKEFGKSVGRVGQAIPKSVIDIAVALSDGLHNVPKLYGEEVRDFGAVKGIKSGGIKAMENLTYNFYDGCSGIFTSPYKGARENGVLGFATGIGKSSLGFVTHGAAAFIGLLAYPSQGLYRTARKAVKCGTQAQILKVLQAIRKTQEGVSDIMELKKVVDIFDEVCGNEKELVKFVFK